MSAYQFPKDILTFQHPSYEPLHHYTRVLGTLRRAATPPQRHWAHASLRVNAIGLTTTPIPVSSHAVELALDLTSHRLLISTSRGDRGEVRLRGQTLSQFWDAVTRRLAMLALPIDASKPDYPDAPQVYDPAPIENYWRALSQIDLLLKQFQGALRQPTGPVQFWSHHFDLAMLWFSGRLVPNQDPNNEEYADEQMNFGFSPGDGGIPEPYFYITAYPLPDGLVGSPLPKDAYWHTDGWNGVVLRYSALTHTTDPDARLLEFWQTVQQRGAERMK